MIKKTSKRQQKKTRNGNSQSFILHISCVTYCNIAVTKLLENPLNDEESDNALDDALKRLDDPDVVKDGYYAFVCDKCAAAFGECGRFTDAADLKERARKIYERD